MDKLGPIEDPFTEGVGIENAAEQDEWSLTRIPVLQRVI
jgi:hypothetical protein